MNQVEILAGTEVFGIVYSDASAGGWSRDHATVAAMVPELRSMGLRPTFIVRLRMKAESLWSES